MHKEEIIQIHTMLVQMKRILEGQHESESTFSAYDQFGALPLHSPRRKFYLYEKIRRLFKK